MLLNCETEQLQDTLPPPCCVVRLVSRLGIEGSTSSTNYKTPFTSALSFHSRKEKKKKEKNNNKK